MTISASDIGNILECIGADRIITMDLHAMQIQGFVSNRLIWENLKSNILA